MHTLHVTRTLNIALSYNTHATRYTRTISALIHTPAGTFKIARGTNECGIEEQVTGIHF
jgi:hypothetical protein